MKQKKTQPKSEKSQKIEWGSPWRKDNIWKEKAITDNTQHYLPKKIRGYTLHTK